MTYEDSLWYHPAFIVQKGVDAEKYYQGKKMPSEVQHAIEETRLAAIWAFGQNKLHNLRYYLQPVDDISPDVKAMFEVKSDLKNYDVAGKYLDIEVTRYEEHSQEDIDVFLVNGKLKKAYQPGTIILCVIDKPIVNGKLWKDVGKDLQILGNGLDVFLLGRTHPTKLEFCSARVNPTFDSIQKFDVWEEAKIKYKNSKGIQIINLPGHTFTKAIPDGFNPFIDKLS